MATAEELIGKHRTVYHMTELGGWEQIQQRGLLSTTALLNHFPVSESRRRRIESAHRSADETLHPGVVIRHQAPLSHKRLKGLLKDMEPEEWYKLLNGKVFFWATLRRLHDMLDARAPRTQEVLIVDTRRLVECHGDRIKLSRINSGATNGGARRGSRTFKTIKDYPQITRNDQVAEVTIACCVTDIVELTLRVDRYVGRTRQGTIWPLGTASS